MQMTRANEQNRPDQWHVSKKGVATRKFNFPSLPHAPSDLNCPIEKAEPNGVLKCNVQKRSSCTPLASIPKNSTTVDHVKASTRTRRPNHSTAAVN